MLVTAFHIYLIGERKNATTNSAICITVVRYVVIIGRDESLAADAYRM
jgi:hypothetical protein